MNEERKWLKTFKLFNVLLKLFSFYSYYYSPHFFINQDKCTLGYHMPCCVHGTWQLMKIGLLGGTYALAHRGFYYFRATRHGSIQEIN